MDEWNDFYTALVVAAATSFAVVLAVLQLAAGRWTGTALRRVAAALALIELLVPFLAALIALMPSDESWRVGFIVMGGVGLCGRVWHAGTYLRYEDAADAFDQRLLQLGLPASTSVYLCMIAFAFHAGDSSRYVVASLGVWLIVSGAGTAWSLLTPTDLGGAVRLGRGAGRDPRRMRRPAAAVALTGEVAGHQRPATSPATASAQPQDSVTPEPPCP